MANVKVRYFRESEELYTPGLSYATTGSIGLDLRACFDQATAALAPGQRLAVPSGLAIEVQAPEIQVPKEQSPKEYSPEGQVPDEHFTAMGGFIYSRSGLGATKGLTVAQGVGVIDPDYRGEIIVYLLNTSQSEIVINRGDRVAQLIFQPVARLTPVKVESLTDTERGAGGFGHTGKN